MGNQNEESQCSALPFVMLSVDSGEANSVAGRHYTRVILLNASVSSSPIQDYNLAIIICFPGAERLLGE